MEGRCQLRLSENMWCHSALLWLYWDRLHSAQAPFVSFVLVVTTGVLGMYPLGHMDPHYPVKETNIIGKIYITSF